MLIILYHCSCVNTQQFDKECKTSTLCTCSTTDGRRIDLTPIVTNNAPLTATNNVDRFQYQWLPCNQDGMACGNDGVKAAICQRSSGILKYESTGQATSANFETDVNTGIVTLKYFVQSADKLRQSIVTLECVSSGGTDFVFVKEDPPLTYKFTLQSPHACCQGTGCSAAPPPPVITYTISLSVGSILLIIALCVVVIYLVAGLSVNVGYYKRSGVEMVPQLPFWILLPGLIKDGGLFIVNSVRRGGQRASYDKV